MILSPFHKGRGGPKRRCGACIWMLRYQQPNRQSTARIARLKHQLSSCDPPKEVEQLIREAIDAFFFYLRRPQARLASRTCYGQA